MGVSPLADRDAVLAGGFDLKLLNRDRNRLFLGLGGDRAEVFGASTDQIDAPAD
jgi:hypothetical protein